MQESELKKSHLNYKGIDIPSRGYYQFSMSSATSTGTIQNNINHGFSVFFCQVSSKVSQALFQMKRVYKQCKQQVLGNAVYLFQTPEKKTSSSFSQCQTPVHFSSISFGSPSAILSIALGLRHNSPQQKPFQQVWNFSGFLIKCTCAIRMIFN